MYIVYFTSDFPIMVVFHWDGLVGSYVFFKFGSNVYRAC